MEQLIGALAVFWVWTLVQKWVEAPEWAWYLGITVLSIGWQLLVAPEDWYYGVGIAGLTLIVRRIDDLLLLLGDRVRVDVLRTTRR